MGKFARERESIRRSNKYEISCGTFLHIITQHKYYPCIQLTSYYFFLRKMCFKHNNRRTRSAFSAARCHAWIVLAPNEPYLASSLQRSL